MGKDPAFLFYSKDWLEGTADMLPEEKGVYIDLLCHQHQKGELPTDEIRLARLVGLSQEDFKRIWGMVHQKFNQKDNHLVNHRLNQEIVKRREQGHKKTILGHYAVLIRTANLPAEKIKKIKSKFKLDDYISYPTKEATERLTEWFNQMVNHSGNGDGNGIEDGIEDGNNKDGASGEENKFIAPIQEQVRSEMLLKGLNEFEAKEQSELFVAHFANRDWKLKGGRKMKDWKLSVITWLGNYKEKSTINTFNNGHKTSNKGGAEILRQGRSAGKF